MPRYDNILPVKESKEVVLKSLGNALLSLESDRKIVTNYKSLPKLGVKYALVESGTSTQYGIENYGEEIWYDEETETYTEDLVVWQKQEFTITAAHSDPETYLKLFKIRRGGSEWFYDHFGKNNVGIISIGNVYDSSIPVSGGDYEVRFSFVLTLNYLSKFSSTVGIIEKITGSVVVENIPEELLEDDEVSTPSNIIVDLSIDSEDTTVTYNP